MEMSFAPESVSRRQRRRSRLGTGLIAALLISSLALISAASPAQGGESCGTLSIDIPGPTFNVAAQVNVPIGWSLVYDLVHSKDVLEGGNWAGTTILSDMDANGFPTQERGTHAWSSQFFWETNVQLLEDVYTFTNNGDSSSLVIELGIINNGVALDPGEGANTTLQNVRLLNLDGEASAACLVLTSLTEPAVAPCDHLPLSTTVLPAPTMVRPAKVMVPAGWDLRFDLISTRVLDDEISSGDWTNEISLLSDEAGTTVIDSTASKTPAFYFSRSTYVAIDVTLTNSSGSADIWISMEPVFVATAVAAQDDATTYLANARTVDGAGNETPVCTTWELCGGQVPTIVITQPDQSTSGTDGDDVILGTSGVDVIASDDGDDIICGMGDDDVLYGQNGDDTIFGGDGADKIRGSNGSDVLWGEAGNDDMTGGRDNDWMSGGDGDDDMRGRTGDDIMLGGDGNEVRMSGNGGRDQIQGEGGNDVMAGGARPDVMSGGPGDDSVKGNGGADQLDGDDGDDDIRGGWQNDTIDGGAGTDACNGGTTPLVVDSDTATNCETVKNVP